MEFFENNGVYQSTFRSRLNKLPLELKIKIGEIPYQKGMRASNRRLKVIEYLKEYNIDFTEVGTGTNRFIIRYDGFAIKIALDNEGIADNKQEWVMSELLAPDISLAYEISSGGHMLVAQYCPAFTSYGDMRNYAGTIRKILAKWSMRFLLGDVGISRVNFANWGISPAGKPVCIDYAYIFPANMNLFECICGSTNMDMDADFTAYKCAKCGKEYQDRDLRVRISNDDRLQLFSSVLGIKMTDEFERHDIDPKYVLERNNQNPDMPDEMESLLNVERVLHGEGNGFWNRGGL